MFLDTKAMFMLSSHLLCLFRSTDLLFSSLLTLFQNSVSVFVSVSFSLWMTFAAWNYTQLSLLGSSSAAALCWVMPHSWQQYTLQSGCFLRTHWLISCFWHRTCNIQFDCGLCHENLTHQRPKISWYAKERRRQRLMEKRVAADTVNLAD